MSLVERIALFLPNWVGDVVMATPALRALRRHFDAAKIAFVGRPVALATLEGLSWSDERLVDLSHRGPRMHNLLRLGGKLRRGRFDVAVLFPNSFRTAALARMSGICRLVGYDRDGRGWLLTDKLQAPRDQDGRFRPAPMIDYYVALAERLGAPCGSRKLQLGVTEADEAEARALFAQAGVDPARPVVMLNPGASFGPSKIWDPQRFASVADTLIDKHGAQIIINAAPRERRIAAWVAQDMSHRPAVNFAERDNTLGLLKSLMRRCALLITNDTGARHFGAAFGVGVVTVFGSTDPRWAQIDYERERIVRVDVPCSPCQQKICTQPPGPAYHQCMGAITADRVVEAAEELLADARPAPAGEGA